LKRQLWSVKHFFWSSETQLALPKISRKRKHVDSGSDADGHRRHQAEAEHFDVVELPVADGRGARQGGPGSAGGQAAEKQQKQFLRHGKQSSYFSNTKKLAIDFTCIIICILAGANPTIVSYVASAVKFLQRDKF
jgi:hypothetical protein